MASSAKEAAKKRKADEDARRKQIMEGKGHSFGGGSSTTSSGGDTFQGTPASAGSAGVVPLPTTAPKLGDITLPIPYQTGAAVPPAPKETDTSHAEATNEALFNAQQEAFRLANEEESRGARGEDVVEGAVEAANVPTLDEQDISLAFGQDVDAQSQDFLGKMSSLRDYMGGAGITGGGAMQALATNFELGRLGQTTDAKRSLFLEKAKTDSLDRVRNFQNEMALATQIQRPVAMEWSDFLQDNAGVRLAQEGLDSSENQAAIAAKATKDAGKKSSTGSIVGGALGAIGSIVGGFL